jgi:hypothetical protein
MTADIKLTMQTNHHDQPESSVRDAQSSRREFLRIAGSLTATSALAGIALPQVHAAGCLTGAIPRRGN